MIDLFCTVECGQWLLSDIIFSVIGVLSTIFGTFLGAWLGYKSGYKSSVKSQKDIKNYENKQFLSFLNEELKKEKIAIESDDKIKEKILNNSNLKIIDLPHIEKAVLLDDISVDAYGKIKDLYAIINRMNYRYNEKNNYFCDNIDKLSPFADELHDKKFPPNSKEIIVEYAKKRGKDPEVDKDIYGFYLYNCRKLWDDFQSYKKVLDELISKI